VAVGVVQLLGLYVAVGVVAVARDVVVAVGQAVRAAAVVGVRKTAGHVAVGVLDRLRQQLAGEVVGGGGDVVVPVGRGQHVAVRVVRGAGLPHRRRLGVVAVPDRFGQHVAEGVVAVV